MSWRKKAKTILILPHFKCSPFLERGGNPRYWCSAVSSWRSLTRLQKNVDAISTLLAAAFRPLWDGNTAPLRYGKCQVACEATSPRWSLELPAGSGSSPVQSGWLQQTALKFCPSAISCCTQLVIHESVSCSCLCLSQQAFEAMLATPGKGARVEQSVHLQLNRWNASAEADSLPLSLLKPMSCLSFLTGKSRGSCQGLLVSSGLNQREKSVIVSNNLWGAHAEF